MANKAAQSSASGGTSFLGVLLAMFIALKLNGVGAIAAWSWWWVFSPLWIGLAIFAVIFLIAIIIAAIAS